VTVSTIQERVDGNLRLVTVSDLGPYGNNAYIIADANSGEALIVDMPSGSAVTLEAAAGLNITGILITHTHPDHWADYDRVTAATKAPVYCHPGEVIMPAAKIDRPLEDGDEIAAGAVRVLAVHTPGHTPGSTCFTVGGNLISGDTLFPGGPGRTQSPRDLEETIKSITSRLHTLPDDTAVLPGHGSGTTIGESKREYAVFASRPHPTDLCGDVTWAD
jgi:glyoxylase-like metal-dependent hydrolase (beta-lactamase superfamily II)